MTGVERINTNKILSFGSIIMNILSEIVIDKKHYYGKIHVTRRNLINDLRKATKRNFLYSKTMVLCE